jgi:polyisoprenoid-binding protein YceI
MEATTAKKTATWTLDKAHAKISFAITHMMVSEIDGSFKDFDIKISNAKEDLSDAEIEFSARINSIDTDNKMRDEHLNKSDFFHAEKFPELTFKSKSFTRVEGKNFKLNGDLTVMGVTKNVTLDAKCAIGEHLMNKKTIAGVKVTGTVNRADFGLAAGMPTLALSNEVHIVANAEFIKE